MFVMRFEAFKQAKQRECMAGGLPEVVGKDLLGFRSAAGFQQHGSQRFPYWEWPFRRLDIVEAVVDSCRLLIMALSRREILACSGDARSQHVVCDSEKVGEGIFVDLGGGRCCGHGGVQS